MQFFNRRRILRGRRRSRRPARDVAHYNAHKEQARALVLERLAYWNTFYKFTYVRVAIRNQSTRWGSCSTKRNLNFNYRILLLPPELIDYIVVHELCHLKEFNHSSRFWALVAQTIPDYAARKQALARVPMRTLHGAQREGCVVV